MAKNLIKRTTAALFASAVLLTAGTEYGGAALASSSISSLESRKDTLREQNERRRAEIESLGGDIDGNERRMELISEQIDGVNAELATNRELINAKEAAIGEMFMEIDKAEKSILAKEEEIELKRAEVGRLNAENKANLRRFAKLARTLYINDVSDKIPVLNGSSDWFDYYMYSDVVENIGKQSFEFMETLIASIDEQERLIGELNAEIDELNASRMALEERRAEYTRQLNELEEQRAQLEAEAREKRDYLYALTEENEELQSRIADLNADIAANNAALEALDRELEELIRAAQQNGSDRTDYGDDLMWPLDGHFGYITTYFGYDAELDRMHRGIDVGDGGIKDANVYAAQSGTVVSVSNYCGHNYAKNGSCGCGGGYGNYVVIDHGGELSTLYAHFGTIDVYEGQRVNQGDVLGQVGSTGWSLGFHLHFEVRVNGTAVDPFEYV